MISELAQRRVRMGAVTLRALERVSLNYEISQPHTIAQQNDDLSREVFGLLGLTLDALDLDALLRSIDSASSKQAPFLISTPNVNFLTISRRNKTFRNSVLLSDLCIADGMPLIWISRLLGVPIQERITGADLFDTLKKDTGNRRRRLRVFLFGGANGVADAVSRKLNSSDTGMKCVGALNPGFGTVEDISSNEIIEAINASGADLLAVFLGAEKAQSWLLQNHHRIKVPIRAQFGAAINFEAGTIKRAPSVLRNSGLEWLWRIKEEPYLWRRYWSDGLTLLYLFATGVLPLAAYARLGRLRSSRNGINVRLQMSEASVVLYVSGTATSAYVRHALPAFREALAADKDVVLDCSGLSLVDPRFVGLILMMRKILDRENRTFSLVGASRSIQRALRLNGFGFLLE